MSRPRPKYDVAEPARNRKQSMAAAGSRMATAVGRWFGVTLDESERELYHEDYVRRKSKRNRVGPGATRTFGGGPSTAAQRSYQDLWQEDSSDASEDEIELPTNVPTTTDYKEGMAHYRDLRRDELAKVQKPGWFRKEVNKARPSVANLLGETETQRGQSKQPHRKHAKLRNDTLVAAQLQALPTFTPWLIYFLTLAHVIIFLGLATHAQRSGEWADIGFSKTEACSVSPASDPPCPEGFNTSQMDGLTRRIDRNYLIGPTSKYLVRVGAKYTPCMREDTDVRINAANEIDEQCGIINTCESNDPDDGYGCCALPSGRKGLTTKEECEAADSGSSWDSQEACNEDTDFIVIRPCCAAGLSSKCQMLTRTACDYVDGIWHEESQLCANTSCLTDVCQLERAGTLEASDEQPNLPADPNQWLRFIIPLFVHAGLIQLIFIVIVQWNVGIPIETQAGFVRTFLIYMISGIGGYVISGIFAPQQVTTGADPAVYGLLAVMLVELFQSWQIVENRWHSLMKLVGLTLFLLLVGTLPFIDNWSHIGGFAFGAVSGVVFLPYITFGSWDVTRKRLLLAICMPMLLVMFILALIGFYNVQNTEFCTWCKYLNCVPYSDVIDCDNSNFDVEFSVSVGI